MCYKTQYSNIKKPNVKIFVNIGKPSPRSMGPMFSVNPFWKSSSSVTAVIREVWNSFNADSLKVCDIG